MISRIPLVIEMGEQLRAGEKISVGQFTAAYGQLLEYFPKEATNSLEKMVGAFFEVCCCHF